LVEVRATGRRSVVEFTCQPGEAVPLWDEFQPAMLRLELKLATFVGGQSFTDRQQVSFGLGDFKRTGARLAINGRTVSLGPVQSRTGLPPASARSPPRMAMASNLTAGRPCFYGIASR
jgi:hypothetical protein